MISGVCTCTPWNLCRKYHSTLHLHNLILTTFVHLNIRVLYLHNPKSSTPISLYSALAQPNCYYICNMVSQFCTCTIWNLYLYCKITYLTLQSCKLIFITLAKHSVACESFFVCMFSYIYIFRTHLHNLTFTTFVQHDTRFLAIVAIIYDETFSNSFH